MAYGTFPDYPEFLMDGYQEKSTPAVNRTDFEDGYSKQDPVGSQTLASAPVKYRVTTRQRKEDFQAWVKNEIRGVLWFEWTDPTNGLARRARILKGEVTYDPQTNRFDEWQISFTIEYWS